MDDLIIRSAYPMDLEEARNWIMKDSGVTQGLTTFQPSSSPVALDNAEDCWAVEQDGELVGLASLTEDRSRIARIGFVVKPSRRREGIAKAFIPRLLEHQDMKRFSKIIGTPSMGDVAALKIFRRAGFYQTGTDENGSIIFEHR